ncbi:putative 2-aminoethylphosphonate ABC transporter ATP-binding protein [Aliagarivorans marinus]|uniref:putative 2-aminoethylphosphonate ABC transporter ATP-binding protein n=1 Tax=Aliagarivorans marinus TaxID=561965 RepID=UPI000420AEB0|nr:putative 2-aminoethylphosphonate ABC transporter ATP-binding protein [Aliagarivorans marinus]
MSTSEHYLVIDRLAKQFGQFTALKEISLHIEKGEFVCFLGPSGCGKTTLLRAIAGLDLPSSGKITQNGADTTFLPPEKRDFGIVFQSYALFPNLTVQENIALGLKNQGMSTQDALGKVEEWLALIGLPGSGHKFPNQLSGGQQQRVALARALALSPGLLLLDEPLSALDAKVRTHLRDEICQLQRKLGITTIMVTHDQDEALTMADRIVVMNHGVIEQVGTPQEIYQQPASRFVAEFVGKMNFIESSVVAERQLRVAESIFDSPELSNHQPEVGELLSLAVRPERVRFVDASEQSLPVKVCCQEFMGAFYRVECELLNDSEAELVIADIGIEAHTKLALQDGDIRHIDISSCGMLAYPSALAS